MAGFDIGSLQRYIFTKTKFLALFLISALQETRHEARREPLVSSKVVVEIRQDVSLLLPEVHCFLVFSVGFEEEHIDDRKVARVSVSFKLFSYPCSESRDGQRDIVHRLDFRCASDPFAVGRKDSTFRIRPTGGLRRLLGELSRRDRKSVV